MPHTVLYIALTSQNNMHLQQNNPLTPQRSSTLPIGQFSEAEHFTHDEYLKCMNSIDHNIIINLSQKVIFIICCLPNFHKLAFDLYLMQI